MHVLTNSVHAGRHDLRTLGLHAPPIDRSTTYPLSSLEEGTHSLEELAGGAKSASNPVYQRLLNPTVARWEAGVAALEGAEAAVAFASGMAAITATLMAAKASGKAHVVAVRPIYGGTDHLLATALLGGEVTWATPDSVAEAIRPDTGLVLLETPANPTLAMVDIADVVAQAAGVPVAVDNTFATPVLQNPLALGATYAIHSATKALGGHGDVTGGIVACGEAAAQPLRQVRILTGAVLDPQAGWLLHRGLATLALRVRASQEGAAVVAGRLAAHPGVATVTYPGLSGGDPLGLVGRQLSGPGSMIAFRPTGGYDRASRMMKAVDMITPAVSLGSVDTLIQHPAGLTHHVVAEDARDAHGISPDLLRLSVGIEHPDDVWADLERALDLSL